MGVVFFGITAIMIQRENMVFLTHKAGLDMHTMTEAEISASLWATLYTLFVSFAVLKLLLVKKLKH